MRAIPHLLNAGALALLLAAVAAPMQAVPMHTPTIPPEVARLASRSLDEVRGAPPELARTLGLATPAEARRARLGTPLAEVDVPLDALRAYAPKTPAAAILTGGTTFSFPVVVGDAIRASIRIGVAPGAAPKALGFGGAEVFDRLQTMGDVAVRLRRPGGASVTAIRIPALGLFFVGRELGGALQIASLFDVPQYGLKRGIYESAETVFARLAPFARSAKLASAPAELT
jgi:hypothetical protein